MNMTYITCRAPREVETRLGWGEGKVESLMGHSPLFEAACYKHVEVMRLLVEAHCDLEAAGRTGQRRREREDCRIQRAPTPETGATNRAHNMPRSWLKDVERDEDDLTKAK